jgi:thioesterase domain-containing protein/acyl carrier protein
VVGGEKASPAALAAWRRIAGDVRWLNTYGPTETSVTTTIYEPPEDWTHEDGRELPIGWPIENVTIHVLDRCRRPVPPGVRGELYIGGAGVARGYLLTAGDATAERFVCLPSADGARVYRTGDVVQQRLGAPLEFIGRVDRQIKLRGFRIEPAEIEAALLRDERVSGALAMPRRGSEGRPALVGYAVVQQPARPGLATDLRRALADVLPAYAMPSTVVLLPGFPLTRNDKIDYDALPEPVSEPAVRSAAPRDELEATLSSIWSGLLGRDVGIGDDFFELGGHSLLAARMFAALERRLDVRLPLAALIRAPTVAELAETVRDCNREDERRWEVLAVLKPGGAGPALFLVHDLGGDLLCYRDLLRHLPEDRPVYGLQALGRDGRSAPITTIEDMARRYSAEMRRVQPAAPYLVAGFSFAGVVAHEIARQLEQEGQHVAFVGLIDAVPAEFDAAARRRDAAVEPVPTPALADMLERNRAALRTFTTSGYAGRATLFRACGDEDEPQEDRRLRWAEFAASFEVRNVASAGVRHLTVLAEPHVGLLARQLNAAIADCLHGDG